jgi:hypothetical protein
MTLTRRQVLTGGLGLAILAALPVRRSLLSAKASGTPYLVAGTGRGTAGAVAVIHAETGEFRSIATGFQAHSFLQNPHYPNRVWTIERWGAHAVEMDIVSGAVVNRLVCDDQHQFYGHGFFTADKETLFISRVNLVTRKGHLVGFDVHNHTQQADYQVTAGGLHQSELLPDGSVLIASSGVHDVSYGRQMKVRRVEDTSLVRVDLKNGQRIDQKRVAEEHQVIGHYLRYGGDKLLVFSTSIKDDAGKPLSPHGYVYTGTLDSPKLEKLEWGAGAEETMRGEMLSAALNREQSHVLVTNPDSRKAVVIDLPSKRFGFMFDLPAKGIAYYPARDAFLASGEGGLFRVRDSIQSGADAEAVGWMMKQVFTSSHNALITV